jgi:hypothetical protein
VSRRVPNFVRSDVQQEDNEAYNLLYGYDNKRALDVSSFQKLQQIEEEEQSHGERIISQCMAGD